MSNKLSTATIDKMWAAWQEQQSLRYVSEKVQISRPAVRKYRASEKWDERLTNIKAKATEKADGRTVRDRARDMRLVEAAKSVWAQQLAGKLEVTCPNCQHQHQIIIPQLKAQFKDLDTFIRLSELLAGDADSRAGTVINVNLLPCEPQPRQIVEIIDNG